MSVDVFAEPVREAIGIAFGDTSDLSEELVNTLCNLYYFALKAHKLTFGGLTDLQELYPDMSNVSLVKLYTAHMAHVTASVSHAPELISGMRASRSKDPSVLAYLEELTIDLLKSPNERPDLAKRFRVPFRSGRAIQTNG